MVKIFVCGGVNCLGCNTSKPTHKHNTIQREPIETHLLSAVCSLLLSLPSVFTSQSNRNSEFYCSDPNELFWLNKISYNKNYNSQVPSLSIIGNRFIIFTFRWTKKINEKINMSCIL